MCSVLYLPSPIWVVFNPVFLEYAVCSLLCCAKLKQTAESCILFFCLILQKSIDHFFYCECTQIKANLLQFRLSSWLRGVASTVRRGKKNQVIAHNAACSFIIIKTTSQTYGKKHTAPCKYVAKSVPLSVIAIPPWSYAKHFFLHGYCNMSEVGLHTR